MHGRLHYVNNKTRIDTNSKITKFSNFTKKSNQNNWQTTKSRDLQTKFQAPHIVDPALSLQFLKYVFFKSKSGSNHWVGHIRLFAYATRDRDNYQTGRHRSVVFERFPSQAGAQFLNKLTNSIKSGQRRSLLVWKKIWSQMPFIAQTSLKHKSGKPYSQKNLVLKW